MASESAPGVGGLRPDFNRVAMRAARAIFEAATPLDLLLEGTAVRVESQRAQAAPWPNVDRLALDEAADGPWPVPLLLDCRWHGGELRLKLSLSFTPAATPHGRYITLRLAVADTDQEITWVTLGRRVGEAAEGASQSIPAYFMLYTRKKERADDVRRLGPTLDEVFARSGLPLTTTRTANLFSVRVPGGEVEPSPEEAYRRLVAMTLLKVPFYVRGAQKAGSGRPLFAIPQSPAEPIPPPRASERKAGIGPLPGGSRSYKDTLDALLQWFSEQPRSREEAVEYLTREYELRGETAPGFYLQRLPDLGLVQDSGGVMAITPAGEGYVADPSPERLFELLHGTYAGMLELLVLIAVHGALKPEAARRDLNELLGYQWETTAQPSLRMNWLLSAGLTDRMPKGDVLTQRGRDLLHARAVEEDAIRSRLGRARPKPDPVEVADGGKVSEVPWPIGWTSEVVELSTDKVRLGDLKLPPTVVDQACAAIRSGKHLLLVGPPGTGKTELCRALARAARDELYCGDVLPTTASADWTTFETIGGYALEKDQRLSFRAGVFPRALSAYRWLLIDELNRADVDKAFGELLTLLCGVGIETAFEGLDGRPVTIGPELSDTYFMPPAFRVLATMNVWDKSSLFKLGFAVQRRFATIHVGLPLPGDYAVLLREEAARRPSLDGPVLEAIVDLFSPSGLFTYREIGPAVARDVVRYVKNRGDPARGLAEALAMMLLPQLEGMEVKALRGVFEVVRQALGRSGAALETRASLEARFWDYFRHAKP